MDDVADAEGLPGIYRGLLPTLLGTVAYYRLAPMLIDGCLTLAEKDMPEIKNPPDIVTDGQPIASDYIKLARRGMILSAAGLIVSYPFHVVTIRMMGYFIGKEKHYENMFSAIASIVKEDGVTGFYHGMIPRFLGQCICISVAGVLTYSTNKYLTLTKDERIYSVPIMTIIGYYVAYPLVVVSNCMAVTCCNMKAGSPPNMPQYQSWIACWLDKVIGKQEA